MHAILGQCYPTCALGHNCILFCNTAILMTLRTNAKSVSSASGLPISFKQDLCTSTFTTLPNTESHIELLLWLPNLTIIQKMF